MRHPSVEFHIVWLFAGKPFAGFSMRTSHRLDATGNDELRVTNRNSAVAVNRCFHTRAAQPVDGRTGNGSRETRKQRGHARNVAVLFTGTVGVTDVDLIDGGRVEAGQTPNETTQNRCRKVVRPNPGECATMSSDSGANGVANEYLTSHVAIVQILNDVSYPRRFRKPS
jgi:hypothetical protein